MNQEDGSHRCEQCGKTWKDIKLRRHERMFCTVECADKWMEAHPEEKHRRRWITRGDVVDSLTRQSLGNLVNNPIRCPWCQIARPKVMPGEVWVHPVRCSKNPANQRN